ncbi:MAG: amidohydrolase family protein [bacterium]
MKNFFAKNNKPLFEKNKNNVSEYLFPFSSKEEKELKEIIQKLPETIIDFHFHLGQKEAVKQENKDYPSYGGTFLYQEIETGLIHQKILSGEMTGQKKHKIYQVAMAFPFQGIDLEETNKWILEKTKESCFLPFLIPLQGKEGLEKNKKALETNLYFGIAEITPQLTEPRAKHLRGEEGYLSEEFLELVNQQELPIVIHLPTHLINHIEEIKELSKDYPKLKIILAHMGLVLCLTPRSENALMEVIALPNVYFDTSTVTDKKIFAYVLKKAGFKKILFASDAPYDALRLEVRFIDGKMQIFSSQDLSGTEKTEEEIDRMLISSPKALLEAIKEIYPNEEQNKLARENIFYQNALEILSKRLPSFNEK